MSDPFLAQIMMFGGNFSPPGWSFCNGSILSIPQNTALFSILGTTFGGDGESTFGLPDLRGRVPRGHNGGAGPGLANVPLGQKAGNVNHQLTVGNLPPHNHPLPNNAVDDPADQVNPGGNVHAQAEAYKDLGSDSATSFVGELSTTGNVGGAQVVDHLDPFLGLNYIIALQGLFPSPN